MQRLVDVAAEGINLGDAGWAVIRIELDHVRQLCLSLGIVTLRKPGYGQSTSLICRTQHVAALELGEERRLAQGVAPGFWLA
jgi:hypothetical protein